MDIHFKIKSSILKHLRITVYHLNQKWKDTFRTNLRRSQFSLTTMLLQLLTESSPEFWGSLALASWTVNIFTGKHSVYENLGGRAVSASEYCVWQQQSDLEDHRLPHIDIGV